MIVKNIGVVQSLLHELVPRGKRATQCGPFVMAVFLQMEPYLYTTVAANLVLLQLKKGIRIVEKLCLYFFVSNLFPLAFCSSG